MNPQHRDFLAAFRETGNVRLACEVAGVELSYRAIAAHLTAEGMPTKQGGRWHHSTIGKVVARREYYQAILGPF